MALALQMATNIKHMFMLVGILVVSFLSQAPSDPVDNAPLLSSASVASFQRELEVDDFSSRNLENRTPIREDEFWLTESDSAVLPFEVAFVPPDDKYGALEPMWKCDEGEESRSKKLIFVNVVRSEAMAVQDLLATYAASCHAGFVSTGKREISKLRLLSNLSCT